MRILCAKQANGAQTQKRANSHKLLHRAQTPKRRGGRALTWWRGQTVRGALTTTQASARGELGVRALLLQVLLTLFSSGLQSEIKCEKLQFTPGMRFLALEFALDSGTHRHEAASVSCHGAPYPKSNTQEVTI